MLALSGRSGVAAACVRPQQPRAEAAAAAAHNKSRCVPRSSRSGAEQAVLTDVDRRNAETESRRAAFEAQRQAQVDEDAREQPWWEVDCPPNMVNVRSLAQLQDAVEREPSRSPDGVGRLVVVNFFAPECYACKSMQPKLRQIAAANPGVLFVKVNGLAGDLQAYCEHVGVTRIPFFHLYVAGKRVAAFAASLRPEKLALLRAEIAAHTPQPPLQPLAAAGSSSSPAYATLEA